MLFTFLFSRKDANSQSFKSIKSVIIRGIHIYIFCRKEAHSSQKFIKQQMNFRSNSNSILLHSKVFKISALWAGLHLRCKSFLCNFPNIQYPTRNIQCPINRVAITLFSVFKTHIDQQFCLVFPLLLDIPCWLLDI